jgi:nucleoside-diphosphate-sugar epimerase
MTRLLITGAAGNIGTLLRPRLARPGRVLRLLDVAPLGDAASDEELLTGDVTRPDDMADACRDVDAVLHLGGVASEAPWEEIVRVNVDGTRNVLEAARRTGVRRVILASSNHAVGFHERSAEPLPATAPPRPDTYYGLSKVAMEALGSLYADRFGMDVAAIRIGTCFAEPPDSRALATWLSPDDAARLVEACLSAPPYGFRLVWGISANTRRWWSLSEAAELGYHPFDDAESYADRFPDLDPDADENRRVGGPFCSFPLGERQ